MVINFILARVSTTFFDHYVFEPFVTKYFVYYEIIFYRLRSFWVFFVILEHDRFYQSSLKFNIV